MGETKIEWTQGDDGTEGNLPKTRPRYRVWWIPQVPMRSFEVFVSTLTEAKLLLTVLADYDLFQFENRVKPDYCNAGGVQVQEGLSDGNGPEWCDWYSEDDDDIDSLTMEQCREIDRRAYRG